MPSRVKYCQKTKDKVSLVYIYKIYNDKKYPICCFIFQVIVPKMKVLYKSSLLEMDGESLFFHLSFFGMALVAIIHNAPTVIPRPTNEPAITPLKRTQN